MWKDWKKIMTAIVSEVLKNSIAEDLNIVSGDEILTIDDMVMTDMIDYNFYCKSENLVLEIKKKNGEIEIYEIEKDFDEDLGIVFTSAVFDKIKPTFLSAYACCAFPSIEDSIFCICKRSSSDSPNRSSPRILSSKSLSFP